MFSFDKTRRRFRLESVHPGHTVEEIAEHTGFAYEQPANIAVTSAPSAETLRLIRQVVAPELSEVYPQFARKVFGAAH